MVADRREASFGAWRDVDVSYVWTHYVDAVAGAGGAPVIFPIADCFADAPELALDCVDGLLLTGGRDVDASAYGQDPDPHSEPGDPLRDRVEIALATAALERELPLLGVCRGMQLLNVALGGGLDQHVDDPDGLHHGGPGEFVDHDVEAAAGTKLASILGESAWTVRSHHHQALDPLAPGLVPAARSPDGLVEAVESVDHAFCIAVLWHPEERLDEGARSLYGALVSAARNHAEVAA
jgi:putative glutamine amidotransferase